MTGITGLSKDHSISYLRALAERQKYFDEAVENSIGKVLAEAEALDIKTCSIVVIFLKPGEIFGRHFFSMISDLERCTIKNHIITAYQEVEKREIGLAEMNLLLGSARVKSISYDDPVITVELTE